MAEQESTLTVFIAFAANRVVAFAKTVAAVISGSASTTAEAAPVSNSCPRWRPSYQLQAEPCIVDAVLTIAEPDELDRQL